MNRIGDFLIALGQWMCPHPGVVKRVTYGLSSVSWQVGLPDQTRWTWNSSCSSCGLSLDEVPVR